MKRYRYANLLMAIMYFVACFGLVGAKTMAYFGMPDEFVNDNPVLASGINDAGLDKVEAVEQKSVVGISTSAKIKQTAVRTTTTVASRQSTVCGGYYGYIKIGGRTVCLRSTDSTAGNLSYSYGYAFNSTAYNSHDQYIFAHNSANLFGNLKNLGAGTRFSVTIGGKTTNYQISKKVVYCDYSNPSHPCSNYSEPVLNMLDAVRPARQGADLALMTCAGQSIGSGDATHRLMVYAVRV